MKVPSLKSISRSLGLPSNLKKADLQQQIIRIIDSSKNDADKKRITAVQTVLKNVQNQVNGPSFSALLAGTAPSSRPWVYFVESPFYKIKRLIHGTPKVASKAVSCRASCTISFTLTQQEQDLLAKDNSYQLYLLGGPLNQQKPTQKTHVQFPQPLEITFNKTTIKDNVKGFKNRPGTPRPANLTPYVRSPPHQNILELVYAFSKEDFLIYCYIVQRVSPESLAESVESANSHISKETTIQAIKDSYKESEDDDLVETATLLSMRCPLSYMKMKLPSRSRNCKHMQCFDLVSYLQLQEQAPTWDCPICGNNAPLKDLAICDYTLEVVQNTPEDSDQIELLHDGGWKIHEELDEPENPQKKKKKEQTEADSIEIISLDSDSDSEAPTAAIPRPAPPSPRPRQLDRPRSRGSNGVVNGVGSKGPQASESSVFSPKLVLPTPISSNNNEKSQVQSSNTRKDNQSMNNRVGSQENRGNSTPNNVSNTSDIAQNATANIHLSASSSSAIAADLRGSNSPESQYGRGHDLNRNKTFSLDYPSGSWFNANDDQHSTASQLNGNNYSKLGSGQFSHYNSSSPVSDYSVANSDQYGAPYNYPSTSAASTSLAPQHSQSLYNQMPQTWQMSSSYNSQSLVNPAQMIMNFPQVSRQQVSTPKTNIQGINSDQMSITNQQIRRVSMGNQNQQYLYNQQLNLLDGQSRGAQFVTTPYANRESSFARILQARGSGLSSAQNGSLPSIMGSVNQAALLSKSGVQNNYSERANASVNDVPFPQLINSNEQVQTESGTLDTQTMTSRANFFSSDIVDNSSDILEVDGFESDGSVDALFQASQDASISNEVNKKNVQEAQKDNYVQNGISTANENLMEAPNTNGNRNQGPSGSAASSALSTPIQVIRNIRGPITSTSIDTSFNADLSDYNEYDDNDIDIVKTRKTCQVTKKPQVVDPKNIDEVFNPSLILSTADVLRKALDSFAKFDTYLVSAVPVFLKRCVELKHPIGIHWTSGPKAIPNMPSWSSRANILRKTNGSGLSPILPKASMELSKEESTIRAHFDELCRDISDAFFQQKLEKLRDLFKKFYSLLGKNHTDYKVKSRKPSSSLFITKLKPRPSIKRKANEEKTRKESSKRPATEGSVENTTPGIIDISDDDVESGEL